VLVAQHPLKLGVHLVPSLARLQEHNHARRSRLEAGACGRTRARRRGGAEKLKKLRVEVWHGKQEMPVARARVSRTGK
jgi:hypothetical protein